MKVGFIGLGNVGGKLASPDPTVGRTVTSRNRKAIFSIIVFATVNGPAAQYADHEAGCSEGVILRI